VKKISKLLILDEMLLFNHGLVGLSYFN